MVKFSRVKTFDSCCSNKASNPPHVPAPCEIGGGDGPHMVVFIDRRLEISQRYKEE